MRSLILAVAVVLAAQAQAQPQAQPAQREHVGLIYFGATRGISSRPQRAAWLSQLHTAPEVSRVTPISQGPLAYARGARLLFRKGGLSAAAFKAFITRPPFKRYVRAEGWVSLDGATERFFEFPPDPETPSLDALLRQGEGLKRRLRSWVQYENADGGLIDALEPPDLDAPLEPTPARWETRFITEAYVHLEGGQRRHLFQIDLPLNEGARRLTLARALRARMAARHPDAPRLMLAAGEDLEHFSFMDTAAPDRQRPNTWWALREMGVGFLAPGAAESAFGLDALQREAQAHDVRVLGANVEGAPFTGATEINQGGLRILIIGLIDPDLSPADRLRGFGARALTDPATAVKAAIEAAKAQGGRPDLIIGFGRLPPARRAALKALDLDLLLADFDSAPQTAERLESHRDPHPRLSAPPLSLIAPGSTRLGVAWITLERRGGRFVAIDAQSEALPVLCDALEPDPILLERIQGVRQAAYEAAQIPLLPDLSRALAVVYPATPPGEVSVEDWRRLLSALLRRLARAELALLPKLPLAWPINGPINRLEAAANLDLPDDAVILDLTAAQLKALIAAPLLSELHSAGLSFKDQAPLILGRPIDDRARYRVVLPSGVVDQPRFGALFLPSVVTAHRAFSGGPLSLEEDPSGAPRKLRDLLLSALASPTTVDQLPALLDPAPIKPSRWLIDLRELAFETHNYTRYGPRAPYANVRETRVTGLESVSVAARGDVALRRESLAVDWINRLTGEYAETRYEEAPDQETADALKAATELQINAWGLLGGVPYGDIAYITELTPTERNPRKRQLEGGAGLVWRGEHLREIKLGGIAARDLSSAAASPEIGLLARLDFKRTLGAMTVFVEGDGRYFFADVTRDTDEDLGMILKLRGGLDVPLIGGLGVGLFIDLFAYRGQIPATHDPGASALTGVRLKYDRLFKPSCCAAP
ncbi:hypothetical protein KJ940_11825 [Myxococcota bacterium]|nr:hypothetical protein [Myxococcota bacterium]